jgi:class 3 adenylate cyclase/tetratricopeptide (TPR) repeat protein
MSSYTISLDLEPILGKIEEAYAEGRWDDVGSLAEEALQLDPSCEEARSLLELARYNTRHGQDRGSRRSSEMRQLTVLMADQVDSTGFAERHDHEIVEDVTLRFQNIVASAVEKYDGKVQHFEGDGIFAYFGLAPTYEDMPRRAVQAALDAHSGLRRLSEHVRRSMGDEFAVRIALHTEVALVADPRVSGSIGNVASRLQRHAGRSAPVISAATQRLVAGYFDLRELGPRKLDGLTTPITVFEVVGVRSARSRFEARTALSPLAGRSLELRRLRERWEKVKAGAFQATALIGEPGVGKSRLAYEVQQFLSADGATVLRTACSEAQEQQQLGPVRSLIAAVAGIGHGDSHSMRWRKLCDAFTAVVPDPERQLPLLAFAAGIPPQAGYHLPDLYPVALREMTLGTIADVIHHRAHQSRVAIVVEDLQWADPSTTELLGRLVSEGDRAPLWLLVTMRPVPHLLSSIEDRFVVGPLPPDDASVLVSHLLSPLPPSDPLVARIVQRSDGVPLYIEELSDALPPDATNTALDESIPPALRDPLQSRLDTMSSSARRLAQIIATIGVDVDRKLLTDVLDVLGESAMDVDALLISLAAAGIIETVPDRSVPAVQFHHKLLRDLAYYSQKRSDRMPRHSATAASLARSLAPAENPHSAAIARHLEKAERRADAFGFYMGAAMQARDHAAYAESLKNLDAAGGLLGALPEPAALEAELNLRMLRAHTLTTVDGYAAARVADEYERALEICRALIERTGVERLITHALIGLWATRAVAGRLDRTGEVLREADRVERERDVGDLGPVLKAIRAMDHLFRGDVARARHGFEEALAAWDPTAPLPDGLALPNCPLVATLSTYGLCLMLSDEHHAADSAFGDAIKRADSLPFPIGAYSGAFARIYRAMSLRWSGRLDESGADVVDSIAIGERHGFTDWVNLGRIHGAALAAIATPDSDAVDIFVTAIEFWRSIGGGVFLSSFFVEAATARLNGGQKEAARLLLEQADVLAKETNQLLVLPEWLLTYSALQASLGAQGAEVAATMAEGREIARRQGNHFTARKLDHAASRH